MFANPVQLVIRASLIKEVSGERVLSVINYTHFISEQIYAEEIFMQVISVKMVSNQD